MLLAKPNFDNELRRNIYSRALGELLKQVRQGEIDLCPPYQRGLVWDAERKERLVDSIFAGLLLPSIYLRVLPTSVSVKTGAIYECVDGKQRLSALADFLDDGFTYAGRSYSSLDRGTQARFRMTTIPTVEVQNLSDEQTEELYDRINFSGVPHDPATRRKAAPERLPLAPVDYDGSQCADCECNHGSPTQSLVLLGCTCFAAAHPWRKKGA